MLKLVEESIGVGSLEYPDTVIPRVGYTIARYQGVSQSGLPIPGWHKVEGAIDVASLSDAAILVGTDVTLRLEDGRALRVTVADDSGRILSEGHGPSRCLCC